MYIKEVNITGFRSYRELTKIDNFSARHNVVVGRNGSGKSNFFFAIQFVLSEEFAHLKSDFRLGLLHEGTGPRIGLARVEIVFDNADHRIVANDLSEVRVVRQVGNKKDQYSIDGKVVTRADVVNLMESAGFSRSNPYYIVKQGKINELATAPDAHRLKLLREVAGTRVYDERKEESVKILEDTEEKRQKIESLLNFIEDRLKTLENEKEDLKEYQKYDKKKRSVEYTIYDLEKKECTDRLDQLAKEREELNKKNNDVAGKIAELSQQQYELKAQKRRLDAKFKGFLEEKQSLQKEKEELDSKKEGLQLRVKDLQEDMKKESDTQAAAKDELRRINAIITEQQEELDRLGPEYSKLLEQESDLSTQIRIADGRLKELFAKQGQKTQFKSKEDRNKFMREMVKSVTNRIQQAEDDLQRTNDAIETDMKEENALLNQEKLIKDETDEFGDKMSKMSDGIGKLRKELEKAMAEKLAAERLERESRDSMSSLASEMAAADQAQRQMGSRPHVNGMEGIKRAVEYFRENNDDGRYDDVLRGFHGFLIDHINCDNMYFQAVEAAAGNRVYNAIVDDDRVAQKILNQFNHVKHPGEANFLPINRLTHCEECDIAEPDARPMLSAFRDGNGDFTFPPAVRKVFAHVFGRVAIIRSLEVGTRICRDYRVDAVTFEGDQVARRGTMTGGYIDKKKSKLELRATLARFQDDRAQIEKSLKDRADAAREKTKAVEKLHSEIRDMEEKMRDYRDKYRGLADQKKIYVEQRLNIVRARENKEARKRHLENSLKELREQKIRLEAEMQHELASQLDDSETAEIDTLQRKIAKDKDTLTAVSRKRADLEGRKHRLENAINEKYLRQREDLERKANSISVKERTSRLDAERSEHSTVSRRLTEIYKRLGEIETELTGYDQEEGEVARQLDDVAEQMRDLEGLAAENSKLADAIVTKQSTMQSKKEESSKKTRELGTLPTEAFSKYVGLSRKELDKALAESMKALKKYENVNKKALDQFVAASQQREELKKRLDEQVANEKAIRDLIDTLDHRKYDAISLTFKQVGKNFAEVFRKLVPNGAGEMTWKHTDSSQDDSVASERTLSRHEIDNFSGISLKVSFGGQDGTREMQQLSGGQKSLVALALIFAIQKCDPAPFYLFDEIDAALDAQHRKAVADMIHELSSNAQFITTTFRAELLEHAEKCYGVRFRNKVSYIDEIQKDTAYDFVEDDATHG